MRSHGQSSLTRWLAQRTFEGQFESARPICRTITSRAETIGWRPTCSCAKPCGKCAEVREDCSGVIAATVLDPFLGAGTTALVADRLGRHCIGIELNPQYAAMAERRIADDAGMFSDIAAE